MTREIPAQSSMSTVTETFEPAQMALYRDRQNQEKQEPQDSDVAEESGDSQQEVTQEQQPQPTELQERIKELAEQYGVKPEEIEAELNKTQEKTEEEPQTEEAPEVDPEKFAEFETQLQTYFGINGAELKEGIEFVRQFRTEQQVNTLKTEWGQAYEQNIKAVQERFASLPPQMQAVMDNVEGARLLYAQIQLEQPQTQAPFFDRGRSSSASQRSLGNKFDFTKTQIDGMSARDYEKQANRITQAYALGRVDYSN